MAEKKRYKIGFSSALSGVEKYHGKAQVDAVKIAFEEAKEEDLDFDLELVIGDDGAEANKAIDVANRFCSDPLVIGVAGPNGSDATKAAAPVYHGAGLPHITFSGSVTDVSNQGYTTFFRLIPNDDAQAEIIIDFMDRILKAKEMLLINDDTKFAIGLNEFMEKYATLKSIKVLGKYQVAEGEDEKIAALTDKVAKINPSFIFFAGMEPICNQVALKLRKKGVKSIYLGTDAIKPSKFLTTPGYEVDGPYQSNVCVDLYRNKLAENFTQKFIDKYGEIYSVYTAEAYVTAKLLIETLKKCGPEVNRKNMLKNLFASEMDSIVGKISFKDNGELKTSKIGFYRFKNQKDLEFMGFSTDLLK